jgi:hypothetical protein
MKYLLYAGEELVGWSALEVVDPPMGCVAGVFHPNGNYEKIKPVICEYSECCALGGTVGKEEYEKVWSKIEALDLVVKPEQGQLFEPVGGVSLIDYAEELEDETGRELRVLGLPHETFIEHFREAHNQYWQQ